jgi:glyoxylase-like metal-dependent hydrolase (beta-lactamase superfamily II)
MTRIPLEDEFHDVLSKAQRGLSLSDEELATQSGVPVLDVVRAKGGAFDENTVRKLAGPLKLGADQLATLGKKEWYPNDPGEVPGLATFNSPYAGTMTVNSYMVWDPKTKVAACFDTGDTDGMLRFAAAQDLKIRLILLTHTHPDHIADLAKLKTMTRAPAFVCKLEPVASAQTFAPGHSFRLGSLQIETRLTSGHSVGGVTYLIEGLYRPVAIVGDAMFASSMGGGMVSYADALRHNRQQILSLPFDTILCPGHGPTTTVAEEKAHNPFFPA